MRWFKGLLLATAAIIGFAATFVLGAELTKHRGVSPEVLAFLRFTLAGAALFIVGVATQKGRRRLFAPTRTDWLRFAWLGPVGTSLMAWCVFMGCARVSAANASMADALTPLMIFAMSAIRLRRINLREIVGLVCGFVGALLVIQVVHAGGLALEAYSSGDVFVLLAAATWAFYTVYGRDPVVRLGSSVFTTWTMLFGALSLGLLLPFGSFAWPEDPASWGLVIALAGFSTLMPFWAWNAAQKYLPMSVLGISAYFTPVAAMLLAMLFLGESATLLQWVGTGFVVLSAFGVEKRA